MKQKLFFEGKTYRFKRFVKKAYAAFNSMHKIVSIGVVSSSMLTFVHATETQAQSTLEIIRESLPDQDLDEVMVSAAKADQPLSLASRIVTIISREEIARQPIHSLQDLLKNVIGVDVRQRGINGIQTDISVRGGTFDQIAILLNGANLSNPQTGHYSFDLPVNLSDIERIEIIQGPSSLLYGASAFSGGINIITKKVPTSKAYFNLDSGIHALWNIESNGSLKLENSTHQLSAGHSSSSGYMHNSDYKALKSLWQSHFSIEQSNIDLQLGFGDKKYGASTFYSGAYPDQFDNTSSLFAVIKGSTGNKLKFTPQMYWNRHWDRFQLFRDGTDNIPSWYKGTNFHQSNVFGANLNFQFKWDNMTSIFGSEFRNEGILSNVLGKPLESPINEYTKSDNRSNVSYFFEHTIFLKKITLGTGILANYNTALHESFDFFPNLNISYYPSDKLKFYASWNNAMRMPTFTDLYHNDPAQEGNPNLVSEKSSGIELGGIYRNSFISVHLTGFYMHGKNVIDWVRKVDEIKYQAQNLSTLNKTGLETGFIFKFDKLISETKNCHLNAGYVYFNQTQNSGDLLSNYALDYLRHKFTLSVVHPIYKEIFADWSFRWQDRMGSFTKYVNYVKDSEEKYPSYSILDLKINWLLNNCKFHICINNLFDTSYYDIGNVPQPGFWFSGGVSYTIN